MKKNIPVTDIENHVREDDVLISRTDLKGRISYVSTDFARISEFAPRDMLGKPHNIIRHPDMPPAVFADMWNTLKSGEPWNGIVKNRARSGNFYWVDATVTPMFSEGRPTGYMSVRKLPTRPAIEHAEQQYARAKGVLLSRKERWSAFFSNLLARGLLISLLFALPVLLALLLFAQDARRESKLLESRRAGALYSGSLGDFAEALVKQRTALVKRGPGSAAHDRARRNSRAAMTRLSARQKRFGEALQTRAAWKRMESRWAGLPPQGAPTSVLHGDLGALLEDTIALQRSVNLNSERFPASARSAEPGARKKTLMLKFLIPGGGTLLLFGLAGFMLLKTFRRLNRHLRGTAGDFLSLTNGDLMMNQESRGREGNDEFGRMRRFMRTISISLWGIVIQIRDSTRAAANVSTQVLDTANHLSDAARNQAASVEESSGAVEELTASLDSVSTSIASHSAEVASVRSRFQELNDFMGAAGREMENLMHLSRQTDAAARDGHERVSQAAKAMQDIRAMSAGIQDIIAIINNISERVELLSLNASIESARAGEAGRGFAVVAQEIAKLSEQTTSSVRKISDLIDHSEQAVIEGSEKVLGIISYFESISEGVGRMSNSAETVQTSLNEQLEKGSALQNHVDHIHSLATTVADTAREQKFAAQELNETTQRLASDTESIARGADNLRLAARDMQTPLEALTTILEHFRLSRNQANTAEGDESPAIQPPPDA